MKTCSIKAFLTLSLGLVGSKAIVQAEDVKHTNVILFLIDDLGWKDLGCYGSTFYQTPNIDKLASQGVRFTNGYAACAVCSPTRAAILTGKYPARHYADRVVALGALEPEGQAEERSVPSIAPLGRKNPR